MKVKIMLNGGRVDEGNRLATLKGWIKNHWVTMVLVFFPTSFLLLIFFVAGLHFFAGINLPFVEFKNSTSAAYWGQLGDFFGGMLNPILSFAALMSVVYGLNLQRKDLQEARKDSSRANSIQNIQTGIYRRQSVEASLLTLITLHLKVVEDMSVNRARPLVGRKAIERLVEEYSNAVDSCYRDLNRYEYPTEASYLEALEVFEKLPFEHVSSWGDTVSRYMRSIFQVMKFIDSRVDAYDYLDEEGREKDPKNLRRFRMSYVEKRQFSNILRSQLSQDELRLIFLNIITPQGEGLRYYVEKYSLLKGLDMSFFSTHPSLIEKVGESAFADYEDLHISSIYNLEMQHKREIRRRTFQRRIKS